MTPSGSVCDQGHDGAPVVDFEGNPVVFDASFEPMPDAPMVGAIDPWERCRSLEAKIALLASRNGQLQRALRGVVMHALCISDKGTAPWYQEALRALNTRSDDDE